VLADQIERAPGVRVARVFVSATDGAGLDQLRSEIARVAAGREDDAASFTVPEDDPLLDFAEQKRLQA
jgi:50S ribosomal subunit-associated GTPase HflX